MKVLIIGAGSELGADFARVFYQRGCKLILVDNDKNKLERIKKELDDKPMIIKMDLASTFNCMKLHNKLKKENIEIVVNGIETVLQGKFSELKLDRELDMIDLNIKAVQTLTKLFFNDFIKKDKGYILNVVPLESLTSAPLMASYRASKNYVFQFTKAIGQELKQQNSNVYVGVLCLGKFNKAMDSYITSKYAVDQMLNKKLIIVRGLINKIKLKFHI